MEGGWKEGGGRQREWFQFERNSSWWWRRRSTGREEGRSPIGGDEMKLKNVLNNLNKTVSWFKVMLFFFFNFCFVSVSVDTLVSSHPMSASSPACQAF